MDKDDGMGVSKWNNTKVPARGVNMIQSQPQTLSPSTLARIKMNGTVSAVRNGTRSLDAPSSSGFYISVGRFLSGLLGETTKK
jgi:hypothetical protein